MSVTVHRFPVVFGFSAFLISEALFIEIHSPITTLEIICIMALTLEPIRGCPQHSEGNGNIIIIGDSQTSLLPIFFSWEGGCLYTG